jgi:hypothetical protein
MSPTSPWLPFPSGNRAWRNQLGLTFFVSWVATVALGLARWIRLSSITGTFGLAWYTISKRPMSIRVALGAAKQVLAAALGRSSSCWPKGLSLGCCRQLSALIVYQASAQTVVLSAVAHCAAHRIAGCAGPVRRCTSSKPAARE